MHVCNAVPLVWGSLRLAPITHYLGNTPKLAYLDVAKLGNKLYSSRRKVVLDIGIGGAVPDTNV